MSLAELCREYKQHVDAIIELRKRIDECLRRETDDELNICSYDIDNDGLDVRLHITCKDRVVVETFADEDLQVYCSNDGYTLYYLTVNGAPCQWLEPIKEEEAP